MNLAKNRDFPKRGKHAKARGDPKKEKRKKRTKDHTHFPCSPPPSKNEEKRQLKTKQERNL